MKASQDMRLFVAAYPPADCARAMLALMEGLDLSEHRATLLEQVHLTLVFIGERSPRDLREIKESVERAAAGMHSLRLVPRRLVTIPTPSQGGAPRLLAIETDAPGTLLELQRRLAQRLARSGGKRERFAPHLTLCRFAAGSRVEAIERDVRMDPFEIREVVLVQSILTRSGAVHSPVSVVSLPAGPP